MTLLLKEEKPDASSYDIRVFSRLITTLTIFQGLFPCPRSVISLIHLVWAHITIPHLGFSPSLLHSNLLLTDSWLMNCHLKKVYLTLGTTKSLANKI